MIGYIVLSAVIIVQSILHYIERSKLQDRIMSRNLTEYKQRDEDIKNPHKSAHDRWVENWKKRSD